MKLQQLGVSAQRFEFILQAVLHGQQQLDAASTRAHHGHAQNTLGVLLHPVQQCQPALVELVDGFDRHHMPRSTGHAGQLWG